MSGTIEGYTCENKKCGKFNRYSMYVYSHTGDKLIHTCQCGSKYSIINCIAVKQKTRTPPAS